MTFSYQKQLESIKILVDKYNTKQSTFGLVIRSLSAYLRIILTSLQISSHKIRKN